MQELNSLEDIQHNTRLCIYGAGDYGIAFKQLIQTNRPDVEILCFIDTFKKGDVSGTPIHGIERLEEMAACCDYFVIASVAYSAQIIQLLKDHGVQNYRTMNPLFNSADSVVKEEDGFPNVLYAFYDLMVSANGYDVKNFLYLAEIERVRLGCDYLHPIIVPPPEDSVKIQGMNYDTGVNHQSQMSAGWMRRNVVVPSCWMLPSCHQVTLCSSRKEAALMQKTFGPHHYPRNYRIDRPVHGHTWNQLFDEVRAGCELPSFSASEKALDFVGRWLKERLGGRKLVTFTLREARNWKERNSRIEEWLKFASSLDRELYFPVVIRDTEVSLEPLPEAYRDLAVFPEVAWNMELRMALYETSFLNLFVGNGPAILCLFNRKTRCLIFYNPIKTAYVISEEYFKAEGLPVGSQYPNATPLQRNVWAEDTFETIEEEFYRMVNDIEAAENAGAREAVNED